MRPTLSICCFTHEPPDLVAAALNRLRGRADEIVVAVDDRVDPDALGPLLDVADEVIRAEFEAPLEANLAWLHSRCHGEWILRVDGDQVASQALLDELDSDDWHRGITHAWVHTAWVAPSGDAVLAQHPWRPDPGLRLVRNLPGVVTFPTGLHEVARAAGHHRILSGALYELGLAITSTADRQAKVARYAESGGQGRTEQGLVINTTYYLPETVMPTPRTGPIAAADQAVIEGLVARGRSGGSVRLASSRAPGGASPCEHVHVADRRITTPDGLAATVRVGDGEPLRWITGRGRTLLVEIHNQGPTTWTPDASPPIRLGIRPRDPDGNPVGPEARAELPCEVPPGATETVMIWTQPPPPGGSLEFGLVLEGTAWFGTTTVPVTQTPPRRVVVSSGVSPFRHLGDDLILRALLEVLAGSFHDVEPVLLVDAAGDVEERFSARTVTSAAPLLHRRGRVGRGRTLARMAALVADARRHRRGRDPRDPAHRPLLDALDRADALLVVPAGALASAYAVEGLLVKTAEVLAAWAVGTPVVVEGASVGPITHRVDRWAVRALVGAATAISVRDATRSREVLRAIGVAVDRVRVEPDPATYYVGRAPTGLDDWLVAIGVDPVAPYVVLGLRDQLDPPALGPLIDAALGAIPDEVPVVLLPHCSSDEVDDARALHRLGLVRPVIAAPMPSDAVAVAAIGGATLALGTRYHLAALAAAAGTPVVALVVTDYDRHRVADLVGPNLSVHGVDADPAAVAEAAAMALRPTTNTDGPTWSGARLTDHIRDLLPPPPELD